MMGPSSSDIHILSAPYLPQPFLPVLFFISNHSPLPVRSSSQLVKPLLTVHFLVRPHEQEPDIPLLDQPFDLGLLA